MKRAMFILMVCVAVPVAAMADITWTFGGDPHSEGGLTTSRTDAVVDTFSGVRPGWTWTFEGGGGDVTSGSIEGVKAAPWGLTDTAMYFCVPEPVDPPTTHAGTATVDFGSYQSYLGIYWGSIDAYNSITFYDGDLELASFTGAQIIAPDEAKGDWTGETNNRYVNFTGVVFDKVKFSTSEIAFEFDNLAVVPLPGAVLLGFLGLGYAGMKLRKMV